MKKIFITIFAVLFTLPALAEKTITGHVIDAESQEALIGATIMANDNPNIGTISDINGNFTLAVPDTTTQIKISYIGYETQILDANANMGNIQLAEDSQLLDNVIVTGCPSTIPNATKASYDIISKKCYPYECQSDRYKLTNQRSVQSRKAGQQICIGSTDEDGPCEEFCEDGNCTTLTIGDECADQVGKECQSNDTNATESEYDWINAQLVCVIQKCVDGYLPNDNGTACDKSEGPCSDEQLKTIEHATAGELKKGICHATACAGGYEPSDGKCVAISGDCDPMPEHATAAHREWDATTNTEICIIDRCGDEYRPSNDRRSCIRPTLTEEESQKKIDELQKNADAMRETEQSTANKLLGGASIAATGIGGMQLASAIAENRADDAAERDMAAYLATFRCDYGAGRNIMGGETDVQLPGGNNLIESKQQFMELAADLKTRKDALEMTPGIESEVILDSATMGLYDDESLGITDGAYTSLSRALSDPDGADAAEWAQQRSDTKSQLTTGAVMAGVGIVGGVVGNLLINRDAPDEKSDEINLKYEPLKKLRDDTEKLSDNSVGAQCPSGTTGTYPNCTCTNTKQIYNGNTNACDTCPGDLVADANGTKCECPAGTVPGIDNACVTPTNEPECVTTEHTQIADDGTCTCTDGYQKIGNQCICPPAIYYINDSGQCVFGTKPTTPAVPETIDLPADSLFDLNKSDLKAEAKTALDTFAQNVIAAQSNQPNYCITITGHTDKTGNDNINEPLSKRRAQAVGEYLISKNIPSENIKTSGVGSRECNTPGNEPDQSCRKVEISFTASTCK